MKRRMILPALLLMSVFGSARAQDTLVEKYPQNRKILLEEFTGLHCPNCPAGHKKANEIQSYYPEDCFLINIHAGNLATPRPGEMDLRSAYGEALAARAGVTGIPSAEINRHLFQGESSLAMTGPDKWLGYAEQILDMESYVNVGAKAVLDWQSREMAVEVQLYYTGGSPAAENFIHVALLQDNVVGVQDGAAANPAQVLPDGSYLHRHVLRELLTDMTGDKVETVSAGSFVARTYTKTLPEAINQLPLDIMELQVVAFVAEGDREVMNACTAPIIFENGPEYVFQMENFGQLEQNTCDNRVRLGFDLANRNPEEKPVEEVTFLFRTEEGSEHEYTCSVGNPAPQSVVRIETDAIPLDKAGEDAILSVVITAVNGMPLTQLQEPESISVRKEFYTVNEPEVTLQVWQDRWGSETSWIFTAEDGTVIDGVSAYPDLSASGTEQHTHAITLAHGCNMFVIRDAMKDGINNGVGEGHLRMEGTDGSVIVSHDGIYTDSLVWLLRYSPVSVEKPAADYQVLLSPNPVLDLAELRFSLPTARRLSLRVFTADGREAIDLGIYEAKAGSNRVALPAGSLLPGLYLVRLEDGEKSTVLKMMVH